MHSWGDFTRLEPDLARQGTELLYHFGVGLAFLATVRPDGGPRLHPMCPLLTSESLFPMEDNEDAFYISGRAVVITDAEHRSRFAAQFVDERAAIGVPPPALDHQLFELLIERAMLTRTTGHGDNAPVHTVWPAGRSGI